MKTFGVSLCIIIGLVGQTSAQDAKDDDAILKHLKPIDLVRFVASGEKTRIDHALFLNPNCVSAGKIFVKVLKKPQHGEIVITDEEGFPSYGEKNLRSRCNGTLSPLTAVYYQSAADYVGEDGLQLLFLYQGNGSAELEDVTVLVR